MSPGMMLRHIANGSADACPPKPNGKPRAAVYKTKTIRGETKPRFATKAHPMEQVFLVRVIVRGAMPVEFFCKWVWTL